MSPLLLRRLSDERLGGRLALGEAAAFDELYRRYVHRLAAYGAHLLGDAAAGDDVAQMTLLRAYQALREGRVPNQLRPWLYRIAHNAAIDLVKRRRELPTATLPERAAPERDHPAGALPEAVALLPDRQRRVYVLRELHGLRIDETASELGLTAQQVEQALFAARNRLAEQLTFGERLGCVSVRRLAAGPLDGDERRLWRSTTSACTPDVTARAVPATGTRTAGRPARTAIRRRRRRPPATAGRAGAATAEAGASFRAPTAATDAAGRSSPPAREHRAR